KSFIFSTGYKAGKIKQYFIKKGSQRYYFSHEKIPLGTGGAVNNGKKFIKSRLFLVLNGDSFCKVDFSGFLKFHSRKKAVFSMVLVKNMNNCDFGSVKLEKTGRVSNFKEKGIPLAGSNLLNAGIYLFSSRIFSLMPRKKRFSLEYDLLPLLVKKRLFGFRTQGPLIDIGTKQGLAAAGVYFKKYGGFLSKGVGS
ncbi:MAG: sugar phosphate nucleotidyltransferase, partial [Candidatus Omnitrophica bacterium]|nr:sugar phosphate nucleotidyltransferase [Candidatus Omnitrophota bacterium]